MELMKELSENKVTYTICQEKDLLLSAFITLSGLYLAIACIGTYSKYKYPVPVCVGFCVVTPLGRGLA